MTPKRIPDIHTGQAIIYGGSLVLSLETLRAMVARQGAKRLTDEPTRRMQREA